MKSHSQYSSNLIDMHMKNETDNRYAVNNDIQCYNNCIVNKKINLPDNLWNLKRGIHLNLVSYN
jgi:hypothetical protein